MTPASTQTKAPPADLLVGRYQLTRRLGTGSSAVVYLATDVRFNREVVVKLFDPEVASDPLLRARFQQQAAKAARLRPPHIANILDAGFTDEADGPVRPFVVTEPAGLSTLRGFLDYRDRLTPLRAVRLARQIAAALSYAHRLGVVHADVKPENVLVDPSGNEALLVDFSLSFVSVRTGAITRETITRRAAY